MRIIIAGQTYYPGNNGQAIFTIHLAEGLARAGHEVHMIVPWREFHPSDETIQGVRVHKVRSVDLRWIHPELFITFFPAGEIRQIFRQFKPDIVHIQDHYFLSRDVVQIARKMHIPVIGTNHFLPENLLPYFSAIPVPQRVKIHLLWEMMLAVYNHLCLITTPTRTAARILSQQKVHPPVVPVSCGVDTCFFHPAPDLDRRAACAKFGIDPDKVLLLYVGRLDHEKRIDLLLRAVDQLKGRGLTHIQLVIAGQGAAGGELRSLAQTLHLGAQVRFLGYVPNADLPLLYQTGQLFAMPSPEELQSIATLEAMASGLPVLAANARALPELVSHEQNGYLFDANQVESAAAGIVYLIEHDSDWGRMGQASRSKAVEHSLDNTIRRYESLYQDVLGQAQAHSGGDKVASTPAKMADRK